MDQLKNLFEIPWMQTLLGCLGLMATAWLAAVIGRLLLVQVTRVLSKRTRWKWDNALVGHGVFRNLARLLPMLVFGYGIALVPGIPEWIEALVARVATALAVLFVAFAIGAALSAAADLYESRRRDQGRTIKGYVQLAKIFVYVFGAIIIIAILINKNAMSLLAGLGAISAVLLLIFKDTILSVVASVQLGSDDMLRVGDWIALPEDDVDGDVVDIALHTVKVVNWDKTVSTVPTWHLISKSFRNYRHMYETGRRIKRAIAIDATSVRFHSAAEIQHLGQFRLLDDYFARKEKELAEWNGQLDKDGGRAINRRRLSNLGSFRAYVEAYVDADPKVNTKMFWAVRQLDPGPTGIPMQIYAYTVDTGFVAHHHATDDIFDHLFAILPEFGLRLFQQPTGKDLRAGIIGISSQEDAAPDEGTGAAPVADSDS